jgi:predicted metalloprotease with PDZ domain
MKRGIEEAEENGADLIIFEIETPGGFVHETYKIVDPILQSTVPTLAWIHNDAISAGSLIALALDLKLRSESGGKLSLDDVMKECWARWGESGEGMPEDGFESVALEVSGIDLGDFFDALVRGTGELPLEALLKTHGVRYCVRAASGTSDKGGSDAPRQRNVWIGATLAEQDGKSVFVSVANGGPAELAGVAPGDKAVALDGLLLTSANLDKRLRGYRAGEKFDIAVFRDDELLTFSARMQAAPENTCYLELADDVELDTESLRMGWLHG